MDAPCTNWLRLPCYLHRIATCTLIGLSIVHLHTRTSSFVLAGIFLTIAATGIVVERTTLTTSASTSVSRKTNTFDPILSTSPKLLLALSLVRATVYAFVGDVAAAQLLFNPYSESEREFEFKTDDWVQLGLAGIMWLMGAMLWLSEPTLYWFYTRNNSRQVDYERLEQEDREEEGEEGETIIVWEEEFTLPTRVDFEKV